MVWLARYNLPTSECNPSAPSFFSLLSLPFFPLSSNVKWGALASGKSFKVLYYYLQLCDKHFLSEQISFTIAIK